MRAASVLCAACALTACAPPRTPHDVAFYRARADARANEVASCSDDPASAAAPDCPAALKAAAEAESQRALRYQPPTSRLTSSGRL